MIGMNVRWVYLSPQNIPRAIVVTLGNKVVLYGPTNASWRPFVWKINQLTLGRIESSFQQQKTTLQLLSVTTVYKEREATRVDTRHFL